MTSTATVRPSAGSPAHPTDPVRAARPVGPGRTVARRSLPVRRAVVALLLALGLAPLVGVAAASSASAADEPAGEGPTSWQVQPSGPEGPGERPYFVYDVDPGAVVEDFVGITNLSEHDIVVAVFGTDALNTVAGDFDLLATADTPTDVGAWVTVQPEALGPDGTLTVPARSRVDVPFWITVPDNATPGDHVGGVVTSLPTVRTTEDGQEVLVDARVGARIYLAVRGDLAPALAVEDVEARYVGDWWNPFDGRVEVSWSVRNTGNLRLAGEQEIGVAGVAGWGATATTVDLPEVLPGNVVEQSAVLDGVPAAVRLEVSGLVQPVDTTDRLDAEPAPLHLGAGLWVVPWLLVAALAVLALAVWLVLRRRRAQKALVAGLRAQVEAAQGEAAQGASESGGAPDETAVPDPSPVP